MATIIADICTKNPCYKTGETIKPQGLMLHSVGCNQPSAAVFVKQWNQTNPPTTVCPHAVIDANTGDVHQTLPWKHRAWHGGGTSNNTHIGVEMCEPACIKYGKAASFTCSDLATARKAATTTYKAAVALFAELCEEFRLDPLTDIVSHYEGNKLGIASAHADPEHLWQGLGLGFTMDGFRKDVKKAMQKGELTETTEAVATVVVGTKIVKSASELTTAKNQLKAMGYTITTTDIKPK